MIKEKDRAWRRYKRKRHIGNDDIEESRNSYTRIRKQLRMKTRKLRIDFENHVSKQIKTNPKIFWNNVSSRTKTRETRVNVTNLVKSTSRGELTEKDIEKAHGLADYFRSVYTNEQTHPQHT